MTLRYMDLGGCVASGALGSSPNKSILPGQQSGNQDREQITADLAHVPGPADEVGLAPASSRDELPFLFYAWRSMKLVKLMTSY